MSEAAMMPEPLEDSKEKSLAVELASLQLTYSAPSEMKSEPLSTEDIEQFRESLLKPAFVRAQLEIEKRFGDVVEVRNIDVREGSILVEALLEVIIAVGNSPIIAGGASGILSSIVMRNVYTPSERKQYQEVLQKVSTIIQLHTENLSGGDFEIDTVSMAIYNPKLKAYRSKKFALHSKNIEKLQEDVEKAIDNYHKSIGKF